MLLRSLAESDFAPCRIKASAMLKAAIKRALPSLPLCAFQFLCPETISANALAKFVNIRQTLNGATMRQQYSTSTQNLHGRKNEEENDHRSFGIYLPLECYPPAISIKYAHAFIPVFRIRN